MPIDPTEPRRQLTPVIMDNDVTTQEGYKDFAVKPQTNNPDEIAEVEEVITPAPKDESAQESASSSTLPTKTVLTESVTPALPLPETTQASSEGADKENGKDSAKSEGAPPSRTTTPPAPGASSSSSSSPTSPGSAKPPAPVKPPTSA